jgi:hypothetical protein|tara:strand:- start:310 stop:447 length:138 start_codon:yes stop_codon:yes gene_type:complete
VQEAQVKRVMDVVMAVISDNAKEIEQGREKRQQGRSKRAEQWHGD